MPAQSTAVLFVVRSLMVAAIGAGILVMLPAQGKSGSSDRPNVLFCLADDWGWPHAGAFGDPAVATPTFDRIAREGALFERAFVSSPSCTPSRNAILTGQQFYRLGQGANLHSTLDVSIPTFVRLLGAAGYEMAHWRKAWGPGRWRAGGYREDPCGPNVRFDEFLARRPAGRPFCFWFGTSDPHRGYEAGSGRAAGIDPAKVSVPAFLPDVEVVRSDIADYCFEVQRFDREVGEAIALLEARGELDDTIVVMTGDHGMPFPRCKGNVYDWGVRVPLALRWGRRVKPGREVDAFVSLVDLAPTFLQAAGVDVPEAVTGQSLLPLLGLDSGRSRPASRDYVIFGRERHTPAQAIPSMDGYPMRGIRTDRWLLILNLEPDRWPAGVPRGATHPMEQYSDIDDGPTKQLLVDGPQNAALARSRRLCLDRRPAVELYDCFADPEQCDNLAALRPYEHVVAALRARLVDHLLRTGDPRFASAAPGFDGYPYRAAYLKKRLEAWRRR
jgi:N-sulfoglucosamine sulfohydrolase